jgi:uncharacterized membrane protein HdeD (DUF308 family)
MSEAALAAGKGRPSLTLRHTWGWTLARGVLALILGLLAIIFPASALYVFTLVFAAFLLVDGVFSLGNAVRGVRRSEDRCWAYLLRGIAGIVVATLFVMMPFILTLSYAIVTLLLLAAWSISAGVLEIAAAIRLRKEIEGEWLLALSGFLSILLGIGVLVLFGLYPVESILSVAWMIGVYAIAAGIILVMQAFRLRNPTAEAAEPALA